MSRMANSYEKTINVVFEVLHQLSPYFLLTPQIC